MSSHKHASLLYSNTNLEAHDFYAYMIVFFLEDSYIALVDSQSLCSQKKYIIQRTFQSRAHNIFLGIVILQPKFRRSSVSTIISNCVQCIKFVNSIRAIHACHAWCSLKLSQNTRACSGIHRPAEEEVADFRTAPFELCLWS